MQAGIQRILAVKDEAAWQLGPATQRVQHIFVGMARVGLYTSGTGKGQGDGLAQTVARRIQANANRRSVANAGNHGVTVQGKMLQHGIWRRHGDDLRPRQLGLPQVEFEHPVARCADVAREVQIVAAKFDMGDLVAVAGYFLPGDGGLAKITDRGDKQKAFGQRGVSGTCHHPGAVRTEHESSNVQRGQAQMARDGGAEDRLRHRCWLTELLPHDTAVKKGFGLGRAALALLQLVVGEGLAVG